MYTIIMDSSKNLITSVKTKIYEGENAADKIQFLIPPRYLDFEILGSKALLKYSSSSLADSTEELVCDENLYKDMLRYTLEVDSELTSQAGIIDIRIEFIKDNGVLKTNNTIVKVYNINDDDVPDEPQHGSSNHSHLNLSALNTYTKTQQELIDELKVPEYADLRNYYTKDETQKLVVNKEDILNRVDFIDESSDDKHYPTAGAVYRAGMDIATSIENSMYSKGEINDSFEEERKYVNTQLEGKADKKNTYTKQEIDDMIVAGSDGADGISCTHEWDGTTLIITSASGTSSSDLKGERGEKGEQGEPGAKGDKGDKGESGQNGANGVDGYTPKRGTDYWTEADKAEIKSYVDEAILGGAW